MYREARVFSWFFEKLIEMTRIEHTVIRRGNSITHTLKGIIVVKDSKPEDFILELVPVGHPKWTEARNEFDRKNEEYERNNPGS